MGKKTAGKKLHGRETNKNEEPNAVEEVSDSKNGMSMSMKDGMELHDDDKGKNEKIKPTQSEVVIEADVDVDKLKYKKKKMNKISDDDVELRISENEVAMKDGVDEDTNKKKKKKKKKKRHERDGNDVELSASQIEPITESNDDKGKKKKKKKKDKNLQEVNGNDIEFSDNQRATAVEGDLNVDKKKSKRRYEVGEDLENSRKEKKRKKNHNDDVGDEKLGNLNSGVEEIGIVDDESNGNSSRNEAGGRSIEGHTLEEDGNKDKKKKAKSAKNLSGGHEKVTQTETSVGPSDASGSTSQKEKSKKVSFSDHVDVFPSSDAKSTEHDGLVRGKRFTPEEDEIIKNAVSNYIEEHQLGEEGINMIMHCKSHPKLKNCWKDIGAALPHRPSVSVYYRAHILFERDEKRKWTSEELEVVRKFHEKHGSDWRTLGDAIGKHRLHVKDAWRMIRLPNTKKGHWSQEEYQTLFDLVNVDLRMKAFEEKKSKHGMLRDNISWEAISDKLETRSNALCCQKWYDQLTSPLVVDEKWADSDDYHLVDALFRLDACCVEDVDWDNLLEHRSGSVCQKRWNQMVKHLGTHRNKPFAEQVEVLSTRYCLDVLEAREAYNSQPEVEEE